MNGSELGIQRFPAAYRTARIARAGLESTGATKLLLTLVVGAMFLERVELEGYANSSLPLPDMFFMSAIMLVAVKLVLDSALQLARPQPVYGRDFALIGLILVIGLISIIPAVTDNYAAQTLKTYFHLLALLTAALVLGRALTPDLVRYTLRSYFVFAAAVSALALLQALNDNVFSVGLTEALGLKTRISGDFVRPLAVFSEPAYLGYASLAGVLIGLWDYHSRPSRATGLGIAFCLLALLVTSAMGPIVIGALLAAFMFLTGRVQRISPSLVATIGLIFLVLMLSPAGDTVYGRIEDMMYGNDASSIDRSALNQGSLEIWKTSPITGVGLGNSRFYLDEFVYVAGIRTTSEFPAANVYLALLGEVGVIGVLSLVAVLVLLMQGKRPWKDIGSTETLTRLLIVLTAMQFLVIGNFLLPPFWLWAGLRLGAQHLHDEEAPSVE